MWHESTFKSHYDKYFFRVINTHVGLYGGWITANTLKAHFEVWIKVIITYAHTGPPDATTKCGARILMNGLYKAADEAVENCKSFPIPIVSDSQLCIVIVFYDLTRGPLKKRKVFIGPPEIQIMIEYLISNSSNSAVKRESALQLISVILIEMWTTWRAGTLGPSCKRYRDWGYVCG